MPAPVDAWARCREILLRDRPGFPADLLIELEGELRPALAAAAAAAPETIMVSDATSRPLPLRLAVVVADHGADPMYQREWVEFAVEARGGLYVVYRFKNGEDHAVPWMPSISLPDGLMRSFGPALAAAVLGGADTAS
jgi:hypothetical protein